MAGANSIFSGDKLLTTPNPAFDEDNAMFQLLGLKPREAFKDEKVLSN
jgi:biotin synthase